MDGSKNVMIIDDDFMLRELYTAALTNAGYTAQVSENAEDLYTKLANFHPYCLFLDVMLPGISGVEILKELRTNPVHGCTTAKIVILTNIGQRSVAESAMALGADGIVIKADILPKN